MKLLKALAIPVSISILLTACQSGTSTVTPVDDKKTEEKPYELTMAFQTSPTADVGLVQDEINKITKSKINATVKLLPINVSAWDQQINLMLTGNDKLDLFVSTSSMYNAQVAKGQLQPLNDLLDKYGKGIKEYVPQEIMNATKVGNNIYGIPSVREWGADRGVVVRKDLLDKYHIDVTQFKTFSDIEPMLKTIKDNEPGIYPLVQQSQQQTIGEIMYVPLFDVLGDRLGVLNRSDNELKVRNLFETKEYADILSLVRSWNQKGYIMKDIATSQESGQSLVKANKAFGYTANMKPGYEIQESRATGKEMVALRLTKPVTQTASVTSYMLSIPKNTGNPEKAMQLMNLLYSDKDVMNLLDLGIEGKHYVKKPDGTIAKPAGVTDPGYVFNQWQVGNNFLTYVWEGEDLQKWENIKKFNTTVIRSKAFGFSFKSDPVKTEIAATTNVINQYRVGLETGTLDPASSLTEFNTKLKAAGLDKIIAEKQQQMDEWAKTSK